MNNKILSAVLVVGIATTGFAGISAANEGLLGDNIEQRVDTLESKIQERVWGDGKRGFGKRKWLKNLTDAEKLALESMSDEEKQVFFEAKKAEKKAQKEVRKAVVDKLIAGESLSSSEEDIRLEALAKIEERSGKKSKPGADIIAKVLAGDELTADEQAELIQMQADRVEREAQRAIIEPIKEKQKAGEQLTEEEQSILDAAKAERKQKKRWGKKGNRGNKEAQR